MATKFTSGPWYAVQADRDYPVRIRDEAGDLVLATADDGGHVDPKFALPDETIFANARLMAAAPDLYDVLKAIGYWPSVRAAIGDNLCAQLDAAIEKASAEQVTA